MNVGIPTAWEGANPLSQLPLVNARAIGRGKLMQKVNETDQQDQVNEEKNLGVPSGKAPKDNSLKAAPSFTRGPWEVGDSGEGLWWVTGPDKSANVICDVVPRGNANEPDHEDYANARLIAAAPELYEAAKKLDALDWCAGYELTPDNRIDLDAALQSARAALAKVNAPKQEK